MFDFAQPSFLTVRPHSARSEDDRLNLAQSFFPTLFVFPIAYFWGVTDLVLRWYQVCKNSGTGRPIHSKVCYSRTSPFPRVVLARTKVFSQTISCLSKSKITTAVYIVILTSLPSLAISMFKSVRRKEWLLVVSMVTALVVNLYQPLAGSLLTIRQLPQTQRQFLSYPSAIMLI